MQNLLKKIQYLILIMALCYGHLNVSAHAGHDHAAEYLADLKSHKGDKYAISLNGEHIGHFIIKSVRAQSGKIILKLDQTFHLNPDLNKKVNAVLTLEKILQYNFIANDKTYLLVVDFQNLDTGSNPGIRVIYDTEHDGRVISSETIALENHKE